MDQRQGSSRHKYNIPKRAIQKRSRLISRKYCIHQDCRPEPSRMYAPLCSDYRRNQKSKPQDSIAYKFKGCLRDLLGAILKQSRDVRQGGLVPLLHGCSILLVPVQYCKILSLILEDSGRSVVEGGRLRLVFSEREKGKKGSKDGHFSFCVQRLKTQRLQKVKALISINQTFYVV